MALESPMAEQKLIELAEAAASLTDGKTRACLSDGDNECASSSTITINSASLPVSLAEEANVLWTTTTPAHNSNSFNFCPVGYVTKARPHYVTRLYDVAFSYPESSYSFPYYQPQALPQTYADPGLTQFVQPSDLVAPALTEEDPAVKDMTELELEVLDLTPTSLTALKALDLLSDVSSRVVVSAPAVPEPAVSLCSTAAAAGMDCVSSNLSVVTLRVPDSSLPVSHALGATAQSECECSLHDVKMKLEVKGGQSSSSSLVELQPPAGYPASEVVTTFVSESLQPVPVITSDVRSAHQRHYQQQMSFRGWPGTVTTRVESSSQKYVSYLPQPAVSKHQRPVRYFTTPPQPASQPTSAPARTTATLQNVSVLMPKRTPAPSTSYLPTSQSPSLSHPLTKSERASYNKATPGIAKPPEVKVVSQPKRKEKAVYNVIPSLPPLVFMGEGRQATPNTFSAQPELKLHPDAEKEKEAAIPVLSPDSEPEPVPHFDPLSIVVEEVSSQPLETAEKESLEQFQETGSGQPNGQCTFCCESYLACPSSSGSDVCLAATCTQSDGKGLKRKMKTEEGSQESAGTRDAAVVAPRRSKRNSTIRCNYCPRLFANTSNVARHVRIFHPASYRPRRRRLTQSEAAARTKPAELAGRKRFKPSGVSVGIQCTLVSNGYDVAVPSTQALHKTHTRSREFQEEFWKDESGVEDLHQEAFRSDSGHGLVTSSFSAKQDGLQHVQQRDLSQARSAAKVSQETDVSSSLIAGIVALMKEKRSKTTKRRGRPASAALAAGRDVAKRHTTSRRLVTSSSDKLTLGPAAACSWNFPSSSSQSTLNFRTKPRTRINSTIPCPYCPRFFSVMSNLKRHTRLQHSDVFVFNCNVCLHKFSMRRTLKKHMQNHADDHPFQCNHCLMRFRFGDQLHVHAKRHDIDKFPCHDCSLTFYTLAHLHQHLRLHH